MKPIALVLAFLLFFTHAAIAIECGKQKDMVKELLESGYGWLSTSITDQGFVLQIFIKNDTRDWTFLIIDNNLDSCVVARGSNWMFSLERSI